MNLHGYCNFSRGRQDYIKKFVLRRAENTKLVCRHVISGKSRCFARNKLNRREINVLNTHTLGLPAPYALLTFIRSKEDRFHHIAVRD